MNRTTKLWPALALAFSLLAVSPQTAPAQTRTDANSSPFSLAPYRTGERLSYNVSFSNFATAAHIEMLVAGRGQHFEREGIEVRAHVETIGIVSAALYAINNDYSSFVDPSTGLPYRLQQIIREGAFSADFPNGLNQANPPPPAGQLITPFPGTFDFLSALYRIRALPLAQGASYRFTIQNVSTPYDVELKVTGREMLKTDVGSSNAIATQVRVHGNSEANDYRIRIYFTDDELHVPLLVTARHRAGEIRAELAAVEILTEVPPTGTTSLPVTQRNAQQTPPQTNVAIIPPQTGRALPAPTPARTTTPPSRGGSTAIVEPSAELPFKAGEQLNFNFYAGANPQPIGTATFQVRQRASYFNRDGYLFMAQLQTTGAGQTLFPVNDQISSYVDAKSLLPFRTELRLREGPRIAELLVSPDQNLGHALFQDGTRVDMPAGTHDLISVFYALRSFNLTPGRQTHVSLLINKRPRLLAVSVLRAGIIEMGGQRIPAVELSLVTNDPEGDRFSLRLWVSTDKRRLPLRLTAQTPLGPIRADLAIIPVTLQ